MAAVVAPRRALPPDLAGLYPFESHLSEVSDGVRIHHVEAGRGDPVVLVHGNPTWSFLYRAFLPPIAGAGHRAIAFDHAGFGLSDHPADPSYYTVERHVRNMEAWADAAGVRDATLVVHDWGGPIGLGWAGRHPDRVKRLVILNTVAFAPRRRRPLSAWHALFGGPAAKLLGQDLNLVVETAMRFGVAKPLPREVLRAYRFPFPTSASRVAPRRAVQMVPDGPDHPEAETLRAIDAGLAALAAKPALVVWGERDRVMPPRLVARWEQALPGIRRVVRLPDAGHFLQEDAAPEIVRELLAFLQATP